MNKARCSIVIATWNRRSRLIVTLDRLADLPEKPDIIVVDNGSSDGTVDDVLISHPRVRVIGLRENIGAAARNCGVWVADTPYVAFCDDDCSWAPGSLRRATALLEAHERVGLVNASVIVDGVRLDEACSLMAESTVPKRSAYAGTAIVQFMAGASIVRRSAFIAAGGYHRRYHIGAEESLLALDLLDLGWELVYDPAVVLHHTPYCFDRRPLERRIAVTRNRLWTVWLRHSRANACTATLRLARQALRDGVARAALVQAFGGLPWILRERRPVAPHVQSLAHMVTELAP